MRPSGPMERTLSKPNGRDHPRKIANDITTREADVTALFKNTMVPAKFRLASAVIIMVEMITVVMGIEAIIEMRLVLASRIIGLGLRENLICRQTSC